jgi:hypothetical protein
MSDESRVLQISAVLFQDGEWWCAQCLEYDIAAQAPTLSELRYELGRVLAAHVAAGEELGRDPFESVNSAPQKFWDMFQAAKLQLTAEDLPFRLPSARARPIVAPRMKIAEQATRAA